MGPRCVTGATDKGLVNENEPGQQDDSDNYAATLGLGHSFGHLTAHHISLVLRCCIRILRRSPVTGNLFHVGAVMRRRNCSLRAGRQASSEYTLQARALGFRKEWVYLSRST